MNTFIFLGYIPVPGWQHKIDFVTKAVLDKKILIFWYEKKTKKLPPQRMPLGVFGVKKWHVLGGKINREAVQVACFVERQEPEKTGAVF